jgi:DivIVA domain-containing protein
LISSHTQAVVSGEPSEPGQTGSPAVSPEEDGDSTERGNVPSEIGDVSFPVSVRGYDRRAVDAYVDRVQRLVAELELTRSPETAVKHALERVGEQTKAILEQAGETVEQISVAARQEAEERTTRARGEADDIVAKAEAEEAEILARSRAEAEATVAQARKEAAEHLQRSQEEVGALREEAETKIRKLQGDTEIIRQQRSQLLDDIRVIATRVGQVAGAADARFPPPEAAEQEEEAIPLQPGATGEADTTEGIATDKPTADTGIRRHSPG